jgi:hypothetical protein
VCLDVEGIDFGGVARGLGVDGDKGRPYLLEVMVDPEVPELLG